MIITSPRSLSGSAAARPCFAGSATPIDLSNDGRFVETLHDELRASSYWPKLARMMKLDGWADDDVVDGAEAVEPDDGSHTTLAQSGSVSTKVWKLEVRAKVHRSQK
jgi:hypothetical protein